MPEYDEKLKKHTSPISKKRIHESDGPSRDGGRGKTPGEELASMVRAETGQDAGEMKIHTDAAADQKARRLGAMAVTEGQAIFFAKDAYQPATRDGRRLIGHELAHGLQQSGGHGGTLSAVSSLEQEADAAGKHLARGEPVTVRERATPGSVLLKEEKKSAPVLAEHKAEVTPTPSTGTISGPGFTVKYAYRAAQATKKAVLDLTVPTGVGVSASPISDVAAEDIVVRGQGGVKARTVNISVSAGAKGIPRVRVTFSKGSAVYLVVFQFPAAAGK